MIEIGFTSHQAEFLARALPSDAEVFALPRGTVEEDELEDELEEDDGE